MDSIRTHLLPVRIRVDYDINPKTGKLERISYVECKNKELLTGSIPFDWAQYIVSRLNSRYKGVYPDKYQVSDPIAILRIDGLPYQKDQCQIARQDKNGAIVLGDSPDYLESIRRASLLGEELFLSRWTQLPISVPVTIACEYHVNGQKRYNLALCNAWVLDLLFRLSIIKTAGDYIVKAMDGSSVKRVKTDPHTLIVIREWRG